MDRAGQEREHDGRAGRAVHVCVPGAQHAAAGVRVHLREREREQRGVGRVVESGGVQEEVGYNGACFVLCDN